MRVTHPQCGATWSGHRIEHCPVCHQTFSGTSTGDVHRTGPQEARRCLTTDELTALGLWATTNPYGTQIWHGKPNKKGLQKRRRVA